MSPLPDINKWALDVPTNFIRLYKKKEKKLQSKVDSILAELIVSENPLAVGSKKKPFDFWAIDIDRSNRLAYRIDAQERTIRLYKVCDHKQVYGKD